MQIDYSKSPNLSTFLTVRLILQGTLSWIPFEISHDLSKIFYGPSWNSSVFTLFEHFHFSVSVIRTFFEKGKCRNF